MSGTTDHQELQTALALHQKGNLNEAANLYRQLIKRNPHNFHALHFLGIIEATVGNIEQAKLLMARSLSITPPNIQFIENYATMLFKSADYHSGIQVCQQGLQLNKKSISLLYISAVALFMLNKFKESITQFDKLLFLQPKHIAALNERGAALAEMCQYEAALASIEKALVLNKHYAEALLNKGNVYCKLKRHDEASRAFDEALCLNPTLANAWLGRGNIFCETKCYDEALNAYDKALTLRPDLANAWFGRGNVFLALRRYDEAFAAYDKALSIKPDLAEAWLGRGDVFYNLNRNDEAVATYDKALAIKPELEGAWLGRGNVFYSLKRYDEAVAAYDRALSIKPDLGVEGSRLYIKMHLCNWEQLDKEIGDLTNSVRAGKANCIPFSLLSLTDLPDVHLRCAQLWVAANNPTTAKSVWQGKVYKHDKIRIAYVSADLHEHATARLMAELFECHNRTKFTTAAFSLGLDDKSSMRQRLVNSFDTFVDCRNLSDADVAYAIANSEIDILVDLKGFTQGSRTNIFAYRPAPIQVNYLGYPGTMGASYHDYIIGDKTLFTLADAAVYSEKLVQLPDSYQPNDRKRQISPKAFTRQEAGLPESKFVFCCFNNNYKILPHTFGCWMRILKCVEGSVLWLLAENQTAITNLKKEAESKGIDPTRLVFANRMRLSDHLARHRLADLFLDTLPYNAHTTASDALWTGLPVLTQIGSTFAGRVAASLLKAIDLPELITHSPEEYEALAIELALNKEKLQSIQEKLTRNRLTKPLFDTPLYTKHLEAAYEAMYQRYQAALPPDHISAIRADGNQARSADPIGAVPKGA